MSTTVSNQVPEPVARLAEVMSGYGAAWSLCGGWAVDAWLGRLSRDHGDVDVSVFADDQRALFDHLDGWQLLAHDAAWEANDAEQWWDGRRRLNVPSHIHARPPEMTGSMPEGGIAKPEDGFTLDIQVDGCSGGDWIVSREPRIAASLDRCVRESPWGLPTATPEVLLFFKSRDMRLRDRLDFAALQSLLEDDQRSWLREAIAQAGHPWLGTLSI